MPVSADERVSTQGDSFPTLFNVTQFVTTNCGSQRMDESPVELNLINYTHTNFEKESESDCLINYVNQTLRT